MFGFRSDKSKAKAAAKGAQKDSLEKNSLGAVSVGFLGKLPSDPDFLSQNVASREVQELDDCLKQWVTELDQKVNENDPSKKLNSVGFALVGGHGRQTIVGSIYDSSDRLGRRYPFSYFVRLTLSDLYFRPALAWFAGEQVLSNVHASDQTSLDAVSDHDSDALVRSKLPFDLPNSKVLDRLKQLESIDVSVSVKQLKSATMENMVSTAFTDWASLIFDSDVNSRKVTKLAMLRGAVERYIDQGANGELVLPLGPASTAKLSLLFWSHLLSLLLVGKEWRPDLIWSMNENACYLYILDRPLTPSRLNKAFIGENYIEPVPFSHNDYLSWAEKMLSEPSLLLLDAVITWGHGK
ncbi:type VI secretion system-associated protein TagF [Marinomonas mediterranea]|uniref:Type VI secretion system-associated protein n=1 Tax=Marinomonas mediterranea (strain ATCC 700492 / JCM 21426 / NBRC 103028 / MMB-1) TaxID=717774 RepID=F2JVZ7_MARM1|nr:type VI secretion system-associated protein TagF [Marinomonas mediterranea]ADZ92885.1 Type VI secretion system-associated protein [Marinomonas mediterranea MMB-1]WCN10818.1 type VI secretion system-associated protein TagF [Marinomonas mediterranea]WCN14875.1 type VI secretion system-associated protein TagF [Marinomonas mediterranea]WCN18907.1 type VI secretion system-associated protein TagF [Marinomonas mediterranea MMB-1]